MSKRLHDSCIWEKKWFREFSPEEKLLFLYIKDRCDMSGVWEIDFDLASFYIGKKINIDVLKKLSKHIFVFSCERKLLIIDFIFFQYGESLNPSSPVHKKVISILSKHKLSEKILNTLSHRVCNTLLHRGKEEDKDIDNDNNKEDKELREKQISDIYAAYPKKVGKGQALKAIGTALNKCSFETLLEHVKKYALSVVGKDPQFIPYPATWFNGLRWEDQEPEKTDKQKREEELDYQIRNWKRPENAPK